MDKTNDKKNIYRNIELYSQYYDITPLCDGLQYSLKCKKDKCVVQIKPHKFNYYKDVPYILCKGCYGVQVKNYDVFRRFNTKYKLKVTSDRSTYYTTGYATLLCEQGHEFKVKEPVKLCPKCVEIVVDDMDCYFIKKRVNKKIYKTNNFSTKLNNISLTMPTLSHKNVKESLTLFFKQFNNTSDKPIKMEIKSFFRFNLKKVLEELNITYEETDTHLVLININDMKLLEEPLHQLAEPESEPESEPIVEEIDDNLEEKKVNEVLDEPKEGAVQFDSESSYEEIINLVKYHDRFVNRNYSELEERCPMFDNKEDKERYTVFKKSCEEKYHNFDPIFQNQVCERHQYSCHHKGEENVNHSFNDYVKSLNKNFDDSNTNFIFYPTEQHKILNKTTTEKYLLDEIYSMQDIKEKGSFGFNDVIESKDDERFVLKVMKTIRAIRNEINKFYTKETTKINLKPFVNRMRQYWQEDFTMTELTINEVLVPIRTDKTYQELLEIDPVLMNTIIFTKLDRKWSPLAIYLKNYIGTTLLTVDGGLFNVHIQVKDNEYIILSQRAAQKMLYFDSGVATLFWKIVFNDVDLIKYNVESSGSTLVEACPYSMFDLDYNMFEHPRHHVFEKNSKFSYIDCRFNLIDFMCNVFEDYGKSYQTRTLITRALMMLNMCNLEIYNHYTSKNTKKLLCDNYYMMLSDEEIAKCESHSVEEVKECILSEIVNMFDKQVSDVEKIVGPCIMKMC